jgi:transcriptional regulator GlxA family with amidase domain
MLQKNPSADLGRPLPAEAGEAPIGSLGLGLVETMLDQLPRAIFFVKDRSLRYVSASRTLLDVCGVQNHAELVGKTARDFFPHAIRSRDEALEQQVMRTQRPLKDRLDFVPRASGAAVWLLLGRWPVIEARRTIGILAIGQMLEEPDRRHPSYERLATVVEHMRAHFGSPLDVASLARGVGISVSQLERDFTGLFGLSPRRYLTKIRFEAALDMLRRGSPIGEIAHACGYEDQSAFTRRFRMAFGMSPSEYRRICDAPE